MRTHKMEKNVFYILLYVYARVKTLILQLQSCCIAVAQLVGVAPVERISSMSLAIIFSCSPLGTPHAVSFALASLVQRSHSVQ